MARRLGVAPATLRTWDRRYGLGPSEHLAGAHRKYSARDVTRLLVMRRLTLEGVAPSEAARAALVAPQGLVPGVHYPTATEVMDAYSDAVPMAPDPAALVAAAAQFDNAAVRWILTRVHPRDVLAWWSELVEPTLRTLSERAVLERPGESASPVLTAAAFAELRSRAAVAAAHLDATASRPVLAIPSSIGSELRGHVLATALQSRGVRVAVLSGGASVVAGAVERTSPAAVLLDIAGEAEAAQIVRAVVAASPQVPVFVLRVGGTTLDLPGNVQRVRTLAGAVHEVLAVL